MRSASVFLGSMGVLAFATTFATTQDKSPPTVQQAYQDQVRPLLQKYCFECHGETKPKGGVRLDALSVDFVKGKAADLETWHDVLQNLHRGEMPPKEKAQPTKPEHGVLVDWLNRAFVEARQQRESTGGKSPIRRLTAYEFKNTLEDLLDVKLNFGKELLPETPSRDGFLNNGQALATSSQHVKGFWTAARLAMSKAIVAGEKPKVYKYRFDETLRYYAAGVAKNYGGPTRAPSDKEHGNVLLPDTVLMAALDGLPTSGRYRIRLDVDVTGPTTRLNLFVKLGLLNRPNAELARVEVSAGHHILEIFGAIDDAPMLVDKLTGARKYIGDNKAPKAGYLCVANVGKIPRQGHGEKFYAAVDGEKVKQFLADNGDDAKSTSVVRVNWIEMEAPVIDAWPPHSHRNLLFDSPNAKDEAVYSREVISRFLERAFRRPVSKAEIDHSCDVFKKVRPLTDSFDDAIRETLAAALASPRFLLLVEPRPEKSAAMPVTDYEWAARLSYFLWNSMPDAELTRLAGSETLKDPDVRKKQVERLLDDDRSWRFVETFVDQWLGLGAFDKVAVNPEFHPTFDEDLRHDMRRETLLFVREFLKKDLSCLKLVDADFTYLSARLADHYGIKHGVAAGLPLGSGMQRVALAPEHKRNCGILTQSSLLLLNSDGVESHPIKRAVWVRKALFDDPPPDPPADVPELKTEDRLTSPVTLKQRIEQHRSGQTCAHCHSRVDPWGFALEQYDALGRFRTVYKTLAESKAEGQKKKVAPPKGKKKDGPQTVDAKAELPDGQTIDGAVGLKEYVLTHGKERFARAIVRKTLSYALGRSIEVADQPLVESLTRDFAANDYRFRALILAIVRSEAFSKK